MSGIVIKSGDGGKTVNVADDNRLLVQAVNESIQHSISRDEGQAYQIEGMANLASGTTTALHIKNASQTRNLVITFIRHQIIGESGGTAFPNTSNYLQASFGRTYASGGTLVKPTNMSTSSGKSADLVVYEGAPVLTGTARSFDRWYTKEAGDMNIWRKEESIIISTNGTLELSYVGDHTSGIIYTRISAIMQTNPKRLS